MVANPATGRYMYGSFQQLLEPRYDGVEYHDCASSSALIAPIG